MDLNLELDGLVPPSLRRFMQGRRVQVQVEIQVRWLRAFCMPARWLQARRHPDFSCDKLREL